MDIVKLRTLKGKILTIRVIGCIDTHIRGIDKFGDHVIIPLEEVDSMMPLPQEKAGGRLN